MNPDLQSLHDILIDTVTALSARIGNAPDSATVDAITTEITEVTHRITILGNVLFARASQRITNAVSAVSDVTKGVQKSIGQIQSATDAVNTMKSFLGLVDKVLDTAKLFLA